jgi:alpha-tubulin suppressor-like RCC1 family protein
VTELVAGGYHTCARLGDGALRCWGSNGAGQLGDGSTVDRRVPTPVAGLAPARQLAAGREHSCALLADDSVWCWGKQRGATLGTGDGGTPGRVTL